MKTLKITLAVAVIIAIAFFVIRSLVITDSPTIVTKSTNQFIERIRHEIDSLNNFPNNKFSKELYKEIGYHIEDYHKDGRLGNTPFNNNQMRETLTNDLYTAYTNKFVKQVFHVFNGSQWEINDLNFIRSEYQTLRGSKFLKGGSDIDKRFKETQNILSKYNEISNFITANKGFSYSGTGLSDRFPISDVEGRISKAKAYLNNNLGNQYVSKCTRLRAGLKSTPQSLFSAHVRYLDNKINEWSGMYSNFNSQRAYADNLYQPLKSEISTLSNDIYAGSDIDGEYNRLMRKLDSDSQKAYNYFQ